MIATAFRLPKVFDIGVSLPLGAWRRIHILELFDGGDDQFRRSFVLVDLQLIFAVSVQAFFRYGAGGLVVRWNELEGGLLTAWIELRLINTHAAQ